MRVAVIGSGVAGLGAAYVLAKAHDVELFEQDARPGGHANTVTYDGLTLDTGFLVHNLRNYPLLTRLFTELGVETQEAEMSFSVVCDSCGLEYSGRRPFAQRRNLVRPAHYKLLWEIGRWLRTAGRTLEEADWESQSLGEYLDAHGYSSAFRNHFLIPLTSALWSTAPGRALEFPAAYAIRFYDNHGMLGFGRFAWRTVTGGSKTYVDAVVATLPNGARLNQGVRSIARSEGGVDVRTPDGLTHRFDRVVIATHADEALALLEDPSDAERAILGAFAYTVNETILHTDASLLPRTKAARGSWNYRMGNDGAPTLTYYLNRLQRLESTRDYCVTLNEEIPEAHVLARFSYAHPLFTVGTIDAQHALAALSGERGTFYAGAHMGNGFHEAGLASGVRAAAALGVEW
ncbi:unannotated protein [freshwater metagenome]|uniref:Unannotated protein n=1 Tax=freshwater metagenome TaxID=449393 RepID=A0A6J6NKL2_9ZZZZ